MLSYTLHFFPFSLSLSLFLYCFTYAHAKSIMEAPTQPSKNIAVINDSIKKPKRKDKDDKEEKPFRCVGFGDCSMAFTRQEHLNRHKRRHTGEVKKKKEKVRFIFTHYSS